MWSLLQLFAWKQQREGINTASCSRKINNRSEQLIVRREVVRHHSKFLIVEHHVGMIPNNGYYCETISSNDSCKYLFTLWMSNRWYFDSKNFVYFLCFNVHISLLFFLVCYRVLGGKYGYAMEKLTRDRQWYQVVPIILKIFIWLR